MKTEGKFEGLIGEELATRLREAGFDSLSALAKISSWELAEKANISASVALQIVKSVQAGQERRETRRPESPPAEEPRAAEEPEAVLEEEVAEPARARRKPKKKARAPRPKAPPAEKTRVAKEPGEDFLQVAMKDERFRARVVRHLVGELS